MLFILASRKVCLFIAVDYDFVVHPGIQESLCFFSLLLMILLCILASRKVFFFFVVVDDDIVVHPGIQESLFRFCC